MPPAAFSFFLNFHGAGADVLRAMGNAEEGIVSASLLEREDTPGAFVVNYSHIPITYLLQIFPQKSHPHSDVVDLITRGFHN